MAADYPDAVVKVMLLDIAPTYDLFDKADSRLSLAFFHWFFLAQPYPFPEQMSEPPRLSAGFASEPSRAADTIFMLCA